MNERFPVLSKISHVTKILGWILIGVGCVAAMGGIKGREVQVSQDFQGVPSPYTTTELRGRMDRTTGGIVLLGGASGAISGLMFVIFSEVIGVLFAIEGNTRVGSKYFGGAPGGRLPDGANGGDDAGEQ